MNQIKKRTEIADEYRWHLDDLYRDRQTWESDFQKLTSALPGIRAFDGKLTSAEAVARCFALCDQTDELMERLYVYAHMKHHEDTGAPENQGPVNMVDRIAVELGEAASFIEPELLNLPEATLQSFIADPSLTFYQFTLDRILRQKPHTLPKEQQALLAKAGILAEAPGSIFEMLNNADMKFPFVKDEKGAEVELTHARYQHFMESRDRRVRKDAFEAMFATYRKQKNTIATIFNAHVQKNLFYSGALNYSSPLSMALFGDNIPENVYTNLIDTVHAHLKPFQRYLALRKKSLKVDELHMYDLSVPLVPEIEWKIPYAEALATITEALKPMGEEYMQLLTNAWKSGWIDVYENEGKRSGAYSWAAFGTHPFVLMNYEDTLNDMFTIAHEMGHALHTCLAHGTQKYRYAHYTIFIAEIASTLNEALLTNYLLKTITDPAKKAYLLTHYADNFRGTLYVQTLFAEFEKSVHELALKGEPLTVEKFNEIYYALHQKYYGDAVVIDKEVEVGWMRIPHFYTSFYVYKYATGFSAANSFCGRILKEGAPAVGSYLAMLRGGGKDYSLNLLKGAGLDMSSPAPIVEALAEFDKVVTNLESLFAT
jgi:oligoendopeptidase F